ncbi:Uncharacterised protein [uncultured archaeon]|nr:Uncharacterised protein [uncultured archaeon]
MNGGITGHRKDRAKKEEGAVHHGLPSKIDEVQKKVLDRLHSTYFSGFERIYSNQFHYRELLYAYVTEASRSQISAEDAINFHKLKIYPEMQKIMPDKSGGQRPSVIIIAGTSEDHSFEIFSFGAKPDGKTWENAAFGASINIRKEKHIDHTGFFESSAYMVNHMKHEGEHVPYMLFLCDYGRKDQREGNGKWQEIELMRAARSRSIAEWRKTGNIVFTPDGEVPYLSKSIGGKNVKIYLPVVLHDLAECKYYVCEGGRKTEFSRWAGETGLTEDERVMAHLQAIRQHEGEKDYFDELVALNRRRKKINCVDSREEEQEGSAIRLIGGIATKEQRKRILEGLDYFTVSLHFGCGYLTTAMGVHEMGRKMMLMLGDAEKAGRKAEADALRQHFMESVGAIINGKFAGFDVEGFISAMEAASGRGMRAGAKKTLGEVFGQQTSEVREIAKHMYNRGILEWSKSLQMLAMPAAEAVDGREGLLVLERRSKDPDTAKRQQKAYYEKVTLEVAKMEMEQWEADRNDIGSDCRIKVQVKNYENAVVVATMDGVGAYDAITGKEI